MDESSANLILEIMDDIIMDMKNNIGHMNLYYMEEYELDEAMLRSMIYTTLVSGTINAMTAGMEETMELMGVEVDDIDWEDAINKILKDKGEE